MTQSPIPQIKVYNKTIIRLSFPRLQPQRQDKEAWHFDRRSKHVRPRLKSSGDETRLSFTPLSFKAPTEKGSAQDWIQSGPQERSEQAVRVVR